MSDLPTREWADRAMLTGLAYDRDQVRDILNAYADGRLIDGQAIINAQRCRHGMIDEHVTEYNPLKDRELDDHLCIGAPDLRSLLNALSGETDDE